jgi:hypothetical protein
MENHSENCRKNLLEHSLEKENYEIALNEWYFYNEVIDNNGFVDGNNLRPSCELCEHEDLRWQFIICNAKNGNQLKVGSSCIKQFNIALMEKDGKRIYGKDRNSKIKKIIELARINSSNKLTFLALDDLCKIKKGLEQNKIFIECWTQLKINGTLEPNLALFTINNFIKCGMDYTKLDLRVNAKRGKCVDQIYKMTENGYSIIRMFLNDKTRKEFDRIKLK